MRSALTLAVPVAALSVSSTLEAQVDPCIVITRVLRTMQVSAGAVGGQAGNPEDVCFNHDADDNQSPDLVIDRSIDAFATCTDPHGLSSGFAFAHQLGAAAALELSSTAIAHAAANVQFFPTQRAQGTTTTVTEIEFDLLMARRFSLEGTASAEVAGYVSPSQADALLTLTGPGFTIERGVAVTSTDQSPMAMLDEQGTLAPGHYLLTMRAHALGSNVPGAQGVANALASFTLRLEPRSGGQNPRCPQDWNNDGLVDSRDFFAFLADFFSGTADFNGDCRTDSQDFFAFVAQFFVICG